MATTKKPTTKTAIGKATSKIVKKATTKPAAKPTVKKAATKPAIGKTSAKPAAKVTAKPEPLKKASFSGNLNKLKFGKNISAADIEAYNKKIFGKAFTLSDIEFDGHYWTATITATATKKTATKRLRMDYFLNYLRCPEGLRTDAITKLINVAAEKALATGGA